MNSKGKSAIKNIQNLYGEKGKNILEAVEEGKVVENIVIMADTIASIAEQSSQAVSSIQETIVKVRKAFEKLSYTSHDILKFIDRDNKKKAFTK